MPIAMDRRLEKKVSILTQNTEYEEGWRDVRTGIRLADGAIQNWPTKDDEKYIKTLYAHPPSLQKQMLSWDPPQFIDTTEE